MSVRFRLIDLFAGCGGLTRGFVDTGRYEAVFAVEADPHAAATYALNFPRHRVHTGLIENVGRAPGMDSFPDADVVVGGPPCQGFSPLNRGIVRPERRGLWREYL